MNKSTIRQIYKQKRLALTKEEVRRESLEIAKNFIDNLLPKIDNFANQKLAFYVAANNEVDPIFIINHCQKLGNIIALPKIIPGQILLDFRSYQTGDQLISNNIYPNLLEPEQKKLKITPDIIFVPLVAFDKNLNRIGMGGGFYDALMENYRKIFQKESPKKFIGLAYDWQNCQEIIPEQWDQSLDFIVSKNNIVPCNQ